MGLIQALIGQQRYGQERKQGLQQQDFENRMAERQMTNTEQQSGALQDYYKAQSTQAMREPTYRPNEYEMRLSELKQRKKVGEQFTPEQEREIVFGVTPPKQDDTYAKTRAELQAKRDMGIDITGSRQNDPTVSTDQNAVKAVLDKYRTMRDKLSKQYSDSPDVGNVTVNPNEQPDIKNLDITIGEMEKIQAKLFNNKPLSPRDRETLRKVYYDTKTATTDPFKFWASPTAGDEDLATKYPDEYEKYKKQFGIK